MGTIYNQKERPGYYVQDETADQFFETVQELAKRHKMSQADIIAGMKVLELRRRNNLYHYNGDIHDEQMAGMAECIDRVSSRIEDLAAAVKEREE